MSHPCKRLIIGQDYDARDKSAKTCRKFREHGKDCVLARVPPGRDWNDLTVPERQQVLSQVSEPDWLFE